MTNRRFKRSDIPARVAERAATNYVVQDGCHISTYASHKGIPSLGWMEETARTDRAYRAAWVHHHGRQIPAGAKILHTCDNRRCVNPDHLVLWTPELLAEFAQWQKSRGGRRVVSI